MPVHIVVGGQFGSEGKGKVALHFAEQFGAYISVKVSGINAGHTVIGADGGKHIFRILPSASVLGGVTCILSAGCVFKPSLLFEEMRQLGDPDLKVLIDPNAGIITDDMSKAEKGSGLVERIGSTGTGTGEATVNRIRCDGSFVSASMIPELSPYICDTTTWLREALTAGRDVMIEGAQGYGLSVLGSYWPYCTSRDTTASWYCAEAGVSPFDVKNVIMVLRTYPIRVGGNSGPLPYETTWEQVTQDAHSDTLIQEYTSVTKRLRRVAKFDPALVKEAQSVNRANIVVMNFLDYIWDEVPDMIGPNRREFLDMVRRECDCQVTHVGFGPKSVVPVDEISTVMAV